MQRIMTKHDAERGIDILAKTVYRDLKQTGYGRADILAFASNILEHITNDARAGRHEAAEGTASSSSEAAFAGSRAST